MTMNTADVTTRASSGHIVGAMLVALVLLGAVLRIYFLNSPMWYDEMVTLVESVRMPFATLLTQFPSNNNHVFYSVLGRASVVVFGDHAWSLRLPAAVFGIAALPMLYVLGSRVASRFEAIAATALLTVSYHHIWFSQNARGYTILLFCALLMTYLLLAGLREGKRSAYLAYGVVAALSAYTHLTMVLFVIGQAVVVATYLFLRGGRALVPRDWRDPAIGFVAAGLITLALYMPMLLDVKAFFGKASTGASVATAGWALGETLRGLRLGVATSGAIVVGGVLLVLGGVSYLRRDRLVLAFYVIPGAVLVAAVVLLQRPTFPRFFFFLAGFALLILVRGTAVACDWLTERTRASERVQKWLPVAVIAGMTLVCALAVPAAYRYPKQDYERALDYVEAATQAGDVTVVAGGGAAVPYREFYGKPWPRLTGATELVSLQQRHPRVWILHTFQRYIEALEPELMNAIRTHCTTVKTFPGTVADGALVVSRCGPN